MQMLREFKVSDKNSIVLFTPLNDMASEWWEKNIEPGAMKHGNAFAVEHRFAGDIIDALEDDWPAEELSCCCAAAVIYESQICSACKEHTELLEEEKDG